MSCVLKKYAAGRYLPSIAALPFNQMPLLIVLLFVLMQLLIQGGYYLRAVFIGLVRWRIAKTAE